VVEEGAAHGPPKRVARSRKRFHRDRWLGRRRKLNAEDKHSHRPTTHNTYKHRRPPNVVLVLAKKVKGCAWRRHHPGLITHGPATILPPAATITTPPLPPCPNAPRHPPPTASAFKPGHCLFAPPHRRPAPVNISPHSARRRSQHHPAAANPSPTRPARAHPRGHSFSRF